MADVLSGSGDAYSLLGCKLERLGHLLWLVSIHLWNWSKSAKCIQLQDDQILMNRSAASTP